MASLVEVFLGSYSSSAPVDWEAEAYPEYGDFAVLPLLVAFFPTSRFLLDQFAFEVTCCFALQFRTLSFVGNEGCLFFLSTNEMSQCTP